MEKVEVVGVTKRSVVIGLVAAVLFTLLIGTLVYQGVNLPDFYGATYGRSPSASPYTYAWMRFYMAMALTSFVIFIVTLINMVKPVFSRQEVAVIAMICLISGIFNSSASYAYCEHLSFFFTYGIGIYSPTRAPPAEDMRKIQMYLADVIGCGKDFDYWKMVFSTWWSPIRWDYVMPIILWGGALLSALCLVGVFIAFLTRRLYIDVEALTFPVSYIANEMVLTTQPAEGGKVGFFKKYFLIGFLIAFLWYFIALMPYMVWMYFAYGQAAPWGTGSGRYGDIYILPHYDATQLALLSWVPLNIQCDPWLVGWGAILPIDVIVGTLIGWLAVQVIIPVAYTAMGLWTPMPTGSFGYICSRIFFAVPAGGTPNIIWVYLGGLLALAVLPIVRNLGTMGPIFKSIIGREPPEEFDPDRPMPYRIAIWGFIISMLLYVALAAVANVIPLWSLVWILLTALFLFGSLRFTAETGGYMASGFAHPFHHANWPQPISALLIAWLNPISPVVRVEPTSATLMTHTFTSYGLGTLFSHTVQSAGYMTLESFRLAKLSNIRLKDVGIIAIITIVVTMFASGFGTFMWHSILPADKFIGVIYPWLGAGLFFNTYVKNIAVGIPYWMDSSVYNNLVLNPGTTDAAIKTAIGVVLVVALSLARERLPWLRISAAGIILGMAYGMKFWAPFIVALIIKYIVLRIGGVRLFEEKVKPIMIGLFYGSFLYLMIEWIVYIPAWIRGNYLLTA